MFFCKANVLAGSFASKNLRFRFPSLAIVHHEAEMRTIAVAVVFDPDFALPHAQPLPQKQVKMAYFGK
jgi:hypothetical protein